VPSGFNVTLKATFPSVLLEMQGENSIFLIWIFLFMQWNFGGPFKS
jgi:hypothetical protein